MFTFLLVSFASFAGEGMWLPQLLQSLNEKDMKKQGMKINASDVYSINKSSLKDAIVSLGGFCTAEVISKSGLLLTNHHCGFDAIQNHSSLKNNYIRDGFWAKSYKEELPNAGLTATFIIRIDDVTNDVLEGLTTKDEKARQSAINKRIGDLRTTIKKEAHQDVIIRPFFEGNKYYAFVTEVFKDVRLVGAPPSSIGNFGKDTDNWMWPRHTGDFAMFRIYAGKDNKPAAYSPENVPYIPKRALNISLDGVKENDFTMVFGFPGKTTQYLHSAAVEQTINILNPAKIDVRAKALGILNGHMRADEQVKIQYASKYAKIENAYKKWRGESMGLTSKGAVAKKQRYEADFQKAVNANAGWKQAYGGLLNDLGNAYKAIEPYALARDVHNETLTKLDVFAIAARARALINAYENNGATGYNVLLPKEKETLSSLFNEYTAQVDQDLFASLMEHFQKAYPAAYLNEEVKNMASSFNGKEQDVTAKLYAASVLTDSTRLQQLLLKDPAQVVAALKEDPAYRLYVALQSGYAANVSPKLTELQNKLNTLQRQYMQAQMEVFAGKPFYPDANGTLRVTYGQAKGMKPRNGMIYTMKTDLDGVMEKYIPGDYEFDVPQKLIELHAKKDYGRYGENGKMPVCFIATNHTTGGNSGSPALDAYGNLIGLNFDRAWEGTMSDIYYNEDICRNIMVDIRYVVFIVDKFAGAQNLVNEMNFVYPKKAAAKKK